MPSWALRLAWAVPRIWARMPSEIARPAASSAARLMRRPDDSFSIDFESAIDVAERLRCALNASTFVFTRRDIEILLDLGWTEPGGFLPPGRATVRRPRGRPRHIAFRATSVTFDAVCTLSDDLQITLVK